ncbi:hypothetical protein CDAR_296901 [Caerostris darwini]|uniref:Uncharacterized protein n=1 Tax=Caerostris darwini TaxID=1538125 RepID=A0AAV4N7Z2_9ARAC|nr:hypothetical protein CDAR_296901 [Caerostris darwini]
MDLLTEDLEEDLLTEKSIWCWGTSLEGMRSKLVKYEKKLRNAGNALVIQWEVRFLGTPANEEYEDLCVVDSRTLVILWATINTDLGVENYPARRRNAEWLH